MPRLLKEEHAITLGAQPAAFGQAFLGRDAVYAVPADSHDVRSAFVLVLPLARVPVPVEQEPAGSTDGQRAVFAFK